MKELIGRLMTEAGLTEAQARDAIRVISDYAKIKFPVFSAAIDRLFQKYDEPAREDDFMD
jgi:hypothetical protein